MTTNLSERVVFAVSPEMRQRAQQTARQLEISPSILYRMALGLFLERGIDYGPLADQDPTNGNREPAPTG